MRSFLWGLLAILIGAGCTLTPAIPVATPVMVSITQGIEDCSDLLQITLEQPYCPADTDGAVCYATADYRPNTPTENIVSRGYLGTLSDISIVTAPPAQSTRLTDAVAWGTSTIYQQQDDIDLILITLGDTTLGGISAELDTLTLTTGSADEHCQAAPPPGLLVQSNGIENSITVNGVGITIGKTIFIQGNSDALQVYAFDDLSVISSGGVTRVIRGGEQTTIPLTSDEPTPLPAAPFDTTLFNMLPIANLPQPVATSSAPPEQVELGENCVPRASWAGEHIIQRGESLARIAPLYDVTIADLQVANCLRNPNRLSLGQVLRVPGDTPTPQPNPTQPATITPLTSTPHSDSDNNSDVPFTVDALAPIQPGECTYLRWQIPDAQAVYFDNDLVNANSGQEVCPALTTVYSLRVVYSDGRTETINRAVVVISQN